MHKSLISTVAALALGSSAAVALTFSNALAEQAPKNYAEMIAPQSVAEQFAQAAPAETPVGKQRAPTSGREDSEARMKQMCSDRYAHTVGALAYFETKLALTSTQQPLFNRWKSIMLSQAKDRQNDCASRPAPNRTERPAPPDRMTRQEDILKKRLASIEALHPALTALYAALTPDQREIFARRGGQGMRRPGMMGMMRAQMGGRGMPRMMGNGDMPGPNMMGPGRRGRSGPGMPPQGPTSAAPPPPQ